MRLSDNHARIGVPAPLRARVLLRFASTVLGFAAFVLAPLILAAPARASDEYANVHNVAIISVIGDFVSMKEQDSFTGSFPSDACAIGVMDWALDDEIAQRIAALLAPRFTVKTAAYNKGDFYSANPWSLMETGQARIKALILALPAANAVDAYVVVRKRYTDQAEHGAWVSGLGVLKSSSLFGSSTLIYSAYTVEVIDARTGETIGFGSNHFGTGWLDSREAAKGADESEWTASEAAFSAERKNALRDILLPLTLDSLPGALLNARLISETPAAPMPAQ